MPEASIRWGAVIDEWERTDAGQVEGAKGGETAQDRASQMVAHLELSWNEISKA